MRGRVIFASAVIWLLSAGYGFADKMVSGAELRAGLTDFLAEQGYDSDPVINPERLFRPCGQPLAYSPLFGKFQTVEISCPDSSGWKIAIRTKADILPSTAIAEHTASLAEPGENIAYVAVRQSLKSGDVITASDIEIIKGSPSGFSDYFTSTEALVGRKLKRRLGIGKMVRASHLEADWMVREGQPVIMESQFGQVQVLSEGRALENAQWGEMARFLNIRSGQEVVATVISEKKVIIGAKKL